MLVCQTVWIQADILMGLICVQTICKDYQHTTLVGKELTSNLFHSFHLYYTSINISH